MGTVLCGSTGQGDQVELGPPPGLREKSGLANDKQHVMIQPAMNEADHRVKYIESHSTS